MQDTVCLGLVHGDDPEGCCGEGGGRGVHVWDRMYTRGGFMSMYGKTNTVLKNKTKNKNKKQTYGYQRRSVRGRAKLGVWG